MAKDARCIFVDASHFIMGYGQRDGDKQEDGSDMVGGVGDGW